MRVLGDLIFRCSKILFILASLKGQSLGVWFLRVQVATKLIFTAIVIGVTIFVESSYKRTHLLFSYLFDTHLFEKAHECNEVNESNFGRINEVEDSIVTVVSLATQLLSQFFRSVMKINFHFEKSNHILFNVEAQKLCRITSEGNSLGTCGPHGAVSAG